MLFFLYPALIPQRASAPRQRDRANTIRPWRDWCILAFGGDVDAEHIQVAALKGPLFPRRRTHTSTPGAAPGVSSFFVQRRRDTEARQGVRAAGLHD